MRNKFKAKSDPVNRISWKGETVKNINYSSQFGLISLENLLVGILYSFIDQVIDDFMIRIIPTLFLSSMKKISGGSDAVLK